MARTAGVIGGLLAGTGEGMLQQADARRKKVLRQLELEALDKRQERQIEAADARQSASDERQAGLLTHVTREEGTNELIGITKGADTKRLGIKGESMGSRSRDRDDSGLSAGDKRLVDSTIKRHTTGKGTLEGERTDWEAVSKTLRDQGREDLAAIYAPAEGSSGKIDPNSPEYREARRLAEEWAGDEAGWLSTDKTDFAKYGGNRAEAIQAKTLEYLGTMGGKGGKGPAPPNQPAAEGAPTGSGSQADPYRATSQADIDWFKENAPSGAVIEADGKLYTKP